LPYIPDNTFDNNAPENVQNREPRMAFVWGDDWLDYYRIMFKQITDLNNKIPSKNYNLLMEMMTRQVDILRQEFKWIIEFEEIKTFHFNIRIVYGKFIK
jgi:methylase of polypeptide subunit release factors